LFGHPVHQILIVFPLGLLATSVIFDVIYLITGNGRWSGIAYWMIVSGIIGGLIAAPFGFIDWLAIPDGTRAKRVGMWHGLGNVLALIIFALGWWLRTDALRAPSVTALILSFLGVGLLMLTGWLGGELVDRLGIGVDDGANWNAPNSLSGRAASENIYGAQEVHNPRAAKRGT
jgi:uncharacterized membrane protein